MKIIINPQRFIKAMEYTDAQYFSQPYSISPIINRWFNQLAVIELENGNLIHLTGQDAAKYVDIIVDEKVIAKKDLGLALRFHSQHSKHAQEHVKIASAIKALEDQIKEADADTESSALAPKQKELIEKKAELEKYEQDKARALAVYTAIVAHGVSTVNIQKIEEATKSKVKNIVYRPNHGLLHSARAAYIITALDQYDLENNSKATLLNDSALEKLQLMMLFSVVGRKDETGWSDAVNLQQGSEVYREYRKKSGTEYLKYCLNHQLELYKNKREDLYKDAIIVELMGYSCIKDVIARRSSNTIETFIQYVIYKEQEKGSVCSRVKAIELVDKNNYQLGALFPIGPLRKLADKKVLMMNKAHAIELIRCYSLYPSKAGDSSAIGIFFSALERTGFFSRLSDPDFPNDRVTKQFDSFYKIIRTSFDLMVLTGQKTTIGFPTLEEYEKNKAGILLKVKEIYDATKVPSELAELRRKVIEENPRLEFYLKKVDESESLIQQLIIVSIADTFNQASQLKYNKTMFEFQNLQSGNVSHIDSRLNAIKLLKALLTVTPYPGVAPLARPIIAAVKHDRAGNLVKLFFDSKAQAENFKEIYKAFFDAPLNMIRNSSTEFSIEVNREHYKELRDDKLVEFKQVTVPQTITREESLVDSQGNITALDMIKNSQALARLVSTSALSGEAFPDYDYLLRAFEDPIHERYGAPIKENINFPVIREKYLDPKTNKIYLRRVVTSDAPEVRFQEPVTEPPKFEDKVADGWVVRKPGSAKNTIYTKKLAHTLLPPHGKIVSFAGYPDKKWNYFPIGVLSDVRQVDLKDERYVWSENMDTAGRFWVKDSSKINKGFYNYLNAQMQASGEPKRYLKTKVIALDKSKLIEESISAAELIEQLRKRKNKILEVPNAKSYRPSDEVLQDFKMLLRQEQQIYLERFKGNKQGQKQIRALYLEMYKCINLEAARKGSKYAVNLSCLVEQQEKSADAGNHNEILAGNTKSATQAFYATRDELFDRLNLAFHAMEIKKKYQYDVPLLVLSTDKPPYHYTEAMIKADLRTAYVHLRQGDFPYDKTQNIAYELDAQRNALLDANGRRIRKKSQTGDDVYEEKNQVYQQELLVNLFKLGLPLANMEQLEQGQIDAEGLDGEKIDSAIDSIVEQMDVLGGVSREQKYLESVFASGDHLAKERVFLREASLGHASLIRKMLEKPEFKLNLMVLEHAMKCVEKNNHFELKEELISKIEQVKELEACEECKQLLQKLKDSSWGANDRYLNEFIAEKAALLKPDSEKMTYSNYRKLDQEIQAAYDAMNSHEMKLVKREVARFEKNAKSLFGINNQRKANLIKKAVFDVPLHDRINVFSDEEHSKKVQEALASHRISFGSAVKNNQIDESKAAVSYHNVKAKLM